MMDFFDNDGNWDTHAKRFKGANFPKDRVILARNTYDLKAYVQWLIKYYYAVTGKEMAKEKLRHEKYKADKAMYDAEERARELLPRGEVVSGLSLLFTGVKNKLLGWIKRLPGLLAHKTARDIEELLEQELYVVLSDLSKGIGLLVPKEKKKARGKGRPRKSEREAKI